jgi:hypothetical protein
MIYKRTILLVSAHTMSVMNDSQSMFGLEDDDGYPTLEEVVTANVQRLVVAENKKLTASIKTIVNAEFLEFKAKMEEQIPAFVQEGVMQAIAAMKQPIPVPVEKTSYRKFFAFMMVFVVMAFILSQVPVNVKLTYVTNVTHVTYMTTNVTHYTRITYVARVTELVVEPSVKEPDYQCPVTEPVTESSTNTTWHEDPVTTTTKDDITPFQKSMLLGSIIMGPTMSGVLIAAAATFMASSPSA